MSSARDRRVEFALRAVVGTMYLHGIQGVRGAPYRMECPVFVREPGADDEWPSMRLRDALPTRYAIITA